MLVVAVVKLLLEKHEERHDGTLEETTKLIRLREHGLDGEGDAIVLTQKLAEAVSVVGGAE